LINGKTSPCRRYQNVAIGFGKTALSVYPRGADGLGRSHHHPKVFELWWFKVVAILVHGKINPKTLVQPQFVLAQVHDELDTFGFVLGMGV
jgi:hypothetical protein